MMRFLFVLLISLCWLPLAKTQDAKLAQQYYQNGEYEKASVIYEKLFEKSNSDFFFDRYVECLLSMDDFENGEKVIKKQLKKQPDNVNLYVTYGRLLNRQFKDDEAEEQYKYSIQRLPKDQYIITRLANAFLNLTRYDLATQVYERGAELLKDQRIFAFNLGELYRRKGDNDKMIQNYLISLEDKPDRINTLKTLFQRFLSEKDFEELQAQLYARIQENENDPIYPELLAWVFIQRKDYKNAFRQEKALDRRFNENGGRLFRLGQTAANDRDYDSAIEIFDYIVEKKGLSSTYYQDAKQQSLRARRDKLVGGFHYTEEELRQLELQYQQFLDESGRNKTNAGIQLELAKLEAFYLNDLDKAIELLDQLIAYPNVDRVIEAEAKLALADFYLMQGERWEATLLYSQVDKDFKEALLGHEARYRNAKLSYYSGDFQWAQAQFDILKASTSKLIANDALDLSVFIMDNLGLDTTATALEMYADADLLVFQNRFDEAFVKVDSLLLLFPEHALQDDVYYLKGQVYRKKREYSKAAEMYQRIIDNFPEGIRTDNSIFQLAELYERHLDDLEKAKTLYETLFIDYSGSTFAVEARKRFRKLRGDDVQ
ncbi:MAG: hypothetical protein DHS20C18_26840 [Saprospiraceae bacterium]|nr:MAG: hypothetical protein DHS20C18_26840 [Saprospiraceae bacterium]